MTIIRRMTRGILIGVPLLVDDVLVLRSIKDHNYKNTPFAMVKLQKSDGGFGDAANGLYLVLG